MQPDVPFRSVLNTLSPLGYAPLTSTHPAVKPGATRGTATQAPKAADAMAHAGLAPHYTNPAPEVADARGGGPAAKRPRVEDVLQQHASREQLLVLELMGWRSNSQEQLSALGGPATAAAPSGSTDFRALFSRQPPQHAPAQQRPPSAANTGFRTFADVATRTAAAPEDVGRHDVLGIMRAAYNSTSMATCAGLGRTASQHAWPGPDSTVDGFGPSDAAAGGALDDLAPEQLPVDWGIKRSIVFTSSTRFTVHDRAQQAAPGARWRAMQSVINCDLESCDDGTVRYLACQISWRHPEALMDPAALVAARSASFTAAGGGGNGSVVSSAAGGGGGGGGGLLAQRLGAWRSALHSLYGTYRGGNCGVFYVINSAARNPFVALFMHKGVRGCGELCAVVSQSNRVLRGRMLAAGVPFTMPLEKAAGAAGGGGGKAGYEAGPGVPEPMDEAADGDLCDEGPQAGISGAAAQAPGSTVPDNSRESLLLLRGPRAVHGLYDFLLNEMSYPGLGGRVAGGGGAGPGDEFSDLPVLLAPAPFEGGAVWRPSVKVLTMSRPGGDAAGAAAGANPMLAAGAGGDPDASHAVHVMQVSGPLPPWTVRRMCAAMAQLHPAGFSASLEAEPCSIPLNSKAIEARACGDGGAPPQQLMLPTFAHGGALALEELAAWRQPMALPGGRPVKGVTCCDAHRLGVRV